LNISKYDGPLINTAKGIELKTFLTPCEILMDLGCQNKNIYSLSGPCHAEEVSQGVPTSVVLAGEEYPVLKNILEALSSPTFRPYYSHDRLGVELGGALKNIIAVAAGIAIGLGYGMNTLSAIITRGISEIKRYGEYRNTQSNTYNGLSCLGDLITTCCSDFSRNREYGKSLVDANNQYTKLAEGALTVQPLIEQINTLDFDMPLCRAVYEIVVNKIDASTMMKKLISRPLKQED
jgi:glycerol-3-phosphate dehydrogenase (NAD(P)+)